MEDITAIEAELWQVIKHRALSEGGFEMGKCCCSNVGVALVNAYSSRAQQEDDRSCQDARKSLINPWVDR